MAGEGSGQSEGSGGVAARATDRVRYTSGCPNYGVVGAHVDLTVVDEEVVGDLTQLIEGLLVPVGYGLVRVVAAGHDERDASVAKQQVVQRRVGEHHAQSLLTRGDRFGNTIVFPTLHEHYGMGGRGEQFFLFRRDVADPSYLREVAGHEGEGLVLADLAGPQGPHRLLVEGVARQMIATEALYGDDGPAA